MALTQFIVISVLYAVAEIFPIGAAAHFAWIEGWGDVLGLTAAHDGVALDLGFHVGLLLAIALYFWRDLADMTQGLARMAKGKRDPGARLAFQLIVAALPMIAAVFAAARLKMHPWDNALVMAWAAFVVALLLLLFDRACMTVKRIEHAGYGDTLVLGLVQALAVVPGVGRIAILIATGRALGYERRDTARFAFLISIPTLAAAIGWNVFQIVGSGDAVPTHTLLLAAALTFATALTAIGILMNWVRRATFTPFAVYRLVVGANLLAFAYGWI